MGAGIRAAVAAILAAGTLAVSPAQAATTLTMGGTFNPLDVPPQPSDWVGYYVDTMTDKYVRGTGLCAAVCSRVAVYTPEEIGWLTGLGSWSFDASVAAGMVNLDMCVRNTPCMVTKRPFTDTANQSLTDSAFVVFGYSQSATIASDEKAALISSPANASVSFVMLANPNRPDGGILARVPGLYIPFLGVTFNGATPNDSPQASPLTTVDVAGQYDLMSDSPTNPFNLLTMINAIAGYYFVHLRPLDLGTPELQGQYRDTTYYLIPTPTLPILTPITVIPWLGPLIATVLDPTLRVLVETGYDRTINPGVPTMANPFYIPNPIKTFVDFLAAMPVGWDNGIAYITRNPANRPFGTTTPGAYGVGGPPVYTGAVDPYGPPTPYTTSVTANQTTSSPTAAATPTTLRRKVSGARNERTPSAAKHAAGRTRAH